MLSRTIAAILFASGKPVSRAALKKNLGLTEEKLRLALDDLRACLNVNSSGVQLVEQESQLQLATHPEESEAVAAFLKLEVSGELTRPSLEALTIIAYRGPVTKPELEQIRGINCSLILRNLLIRGLIDEREDKARLQSVYTVSLDFLRHLGLTHVSALPAYENLHTPPKIPDTIPQIPDTRYQIPL